MNRKKILLGFLCTFLFPLSTFAAIDPVSVSSSGVIGNNDSSVNGAIPTPDGRYVVFWSAASNLVPNDTNGTGDIFVRDTVAGTTTRVNVSSAGAQANLTSTLVLGTYGISADGRYVAFWSVATNLVPNDTNASNDLFVRDTVAGTTTRVNVSSTGAQSNPASGNGLISLSSNGRYILFISTANNLVINDTNGVEDLFVRDTVAGTTIRVNVSSTGAQSSSLLNIFSNAMTPDGRYVLFQSHATNLVPNDTNNFPDLFVRDTVAGTTIRVNVSSTGAQTNAFAGHGVISITPDGRYVLFQSTASNLVPNDTNVVNDVFVRDTVAGTTIRVNVSTTGVQVNNGILSLHAPRITPDGRYILFQSSATNLVPNDTNGREDAFIRDTVAGTTIRVNLTNTGLESNGQPYYSTMTLDGKKVLFQSSASNLVLNDTNQSSDLFIRDIAAGTTTRVTTDNLGNEIPGFYNFTLYPFLSDLGDKVTFVINKSIHPTDTNVNKYDVYQYTAPSAPDCSNSNNLQPGVLYMNPDWSYFMSLTPFSNPNSYYEQYVKYQLYTLGGGIPDMFSIPDENQPNNSHLAINTLAGYPQAPDGKYDITIRQSNGPTDTVGGALIEQATGAEGWYVTNTMNITTPIFVEVRKGPCVELRFNP